MKHIYIRPGKLFRVPLLAIMIAIGSWSYSQSPTINTPGNCDGIVANFNTNDNGFNSPSVFGSIFDSSFYYNASRGYWTDYLYPLRVTPPGFPRVMDIISPPFNNPNPNGTFNVGFYYIIPDPVVDKFQVRIISVTQTSQGTQTNVEATTGAQSFSAWSTPQPYNDLTMGVAPTTPFMGMWQGNVCIRLVDPDIVNAANTTFRVEVAYQVNSAQFAVFDNLSIGPSQIPLPVEFIGLVANRNNDAVELKWDVGEEINVKEYQVEKSSNGTMFSTAGAVNSKGKSIYTFTDMGVDRKSTIYYRVKSVDNDGRYKYSGIVRLAATGNSSYGNGMTLYPVPAKNEVTLEHKQLYANARITITTADGRILKTIIPSPGSSHTPINLSGITPGIYILRLDDGKGGVETSKFIKQ